MRLALLLPVLICVAAPAYAEGARESRYGPTTPRQQAAAAAAMPAPAPYDGPMLGWANKRQASTAIAVPEASAPTRPAPIAPWAGYQGAPAASAPPPAPTATATPTSLYSAPRPAPRFAPSTVPATAQPFPVADAPAPPAPVKDWSNYRSARVLAASANATPTAPAPVAAPSSAPAPASLYAQPIARQAIAPTPAQPRQVAGLNTGTTGARFYSVGREYGMTPDALPPAGPDSRVLISASDPSSEAKDAVPMHGSADWLAAGVNGDDGDDDSSSAERRAKTRNQAQ